MRNSRKQETLPESIRRIQREIEEWRSKRRPRERVPEELWRKAVEFSRAHGINKIAKALRLDYYSLKKRVLSAEKSRDKKQEFIELLQDAAPIVRPACMIEIEDAGGAKLRISLHGTELPDLAALARAFREAGL